LILGSLKR